MYICNIFVRDGINIAIAAVSLKLWSIYDEHSMRPCLQIILRIHMTICL